MSTDLENNNAGISRKAGVSRREFLKMAGAAGATVGLGAGLGGLVAACGEEAETTTTAGATTTAGVTTTAGATTTVSAGAEVGREVKLGFITPITGGLAPFGATDQYCVKRAQAVIGDGLVSSDGLKHPVTIKLQDSQSDPNRAAQVAGDLIMNDKIDLMLVASTPDNVVPVAGTCEAMGMPCISFDCPWQGFFAPRTNGDYSIVFNWTYHVFFGAEEGTAIMLDLLSQLPTNKIVAMMYPNDADGNSLHPVHAAAFEAAGFTLVDASGFPVGLEDFTEQISMFKKAGAEQGHGVMPPADFTNFWKQSIQQGWMPKMSMWAKSLLFPESLEALGPIGNNLCCDQWWGPDWPFTSTVLGQTCRQFTDDFEAEAKRQWTQPLAHMMLFEWAIDLLQRTVNVDDKNAIMAAIKTTKLDTIAGPVDFSAPVEPVGPPWAVGPRHIVENVYKVGLCAGQWRMGGKYMFDLISVSNGGHPLIQVQDKALPYTEA